MADSSWRVGSFWFPTGEEPERFDFIPSQATPSDNTKQPNTPYTRNYESGRGATTVSIQGKLTKYTEGKAGAFGLEKLEGECAYNGTEKVIVTQAHDGTLRRFYAVYGNIRSSVINTQKNLYGYVISFICNNPFKFDDSLTYTGAISVGATDTTINLGTNCRGTTDSLPIFIIQNESGSTLSNYQMTVGDGIDSGGGNSIKIPNAAVDIPNGHQLVCFPYVWDDSFEKGTVLSVYHWKAITSSGFDVYEGTKISDYESCIGNVNATYPTIASDSQEFLAKGSATGAKLIVQWRKCYG